MVQVVTSKEWNKKVVNALAFMVEAYETYFHKISYRVNATTYPTDYHLDKELHPVMYIVNGLTDLRHALDIKKALEDIADENFYNHDPIFTLSVTVTENSFEIKKEPITKPDSISI